jgi:hypothetical protein
MSAPPSKSAISGTPTNAEAKTAFAALWDYVVGRLGGDAAAPAPTAPEKAAARTALGITDTVFASAAENAAGTVEGKSVDPLGIREALNATGSAPIYAARAWVNFNGTGTVAIRASGNVSSITDNATGDYTVNFTTAMPDANYSPVCMLQSDATRQLTIRSSSSDSAAPDLMTTTQLRVAIYANSGGNVDVATVCLSIFR